MIDTDVRSDGAADPRLALAFWQTRGFWLILAIGATVPFWFTPLPPLGDLFNHIARYHIVQNYAGSPLLRSYYTVDWAVIPNLAQDVPMLGLGPVLGVERAALLLTAAIPFAMVLLIGAISRAAHGAVQPLALLALPFTYPLTFTYGFVNFHTGLVVCFAAILFWLRTRQRRAPWRYGMLAIAAGIAWLCHSSAWAILVVGIAALEAAHAFAEKPAPLFRALVRAALRTLPVLWPVVLFFLAPEKRSGSAATAYTFFDLQTYLRWYWLKVTNLREVLRDQDKLLDYATYLVMVAIPGVLLVTRRLAIAPGLALWALALFALYWILPPNLMGGYYADFRLLAVLGIAGLLALRSTASVRVNTVVVALALSLFGVRIAATTQGWLVAGKDLTRDLAALGQVGNGARIAAISPLASCEGWRTQGYTHLASFAIVRRNAFVSTQWDLPGQQIMQPAYLRGSPYNSVRHLEKGTSGACGTITAQDFFADLPRDRFDYVWVFDGAPPGAALAWLEPLYRGPHGRLYRIRRDQRSSR